MKKYTKSCLVLAVLGGASLSFAQTITPPAVPDGSNRSRAPFAAERPFNDVKPIDGQAIDTGVPPNTAATAPAPMPPPAISVYAPASPAAPDAAISVTAPAATESQLSMTGRATVGVSTSLESARVVPSIRSSMYESRAALFSDVDARLDASDKALSDARKASKDMSDSGKAQFKASEDLVKEKEHTLRESLRAAKKANATEWESARTQLAADYESYVSAVGSLDASAGIQPLR